MSFIVLVYFCYISNINDCDRKTISDQGQRFNFLTIYIYLYKKFVI
jgi:hypothetical protein